MIDGPARSSFLAIVAACGVAFATPAVAAPPATATATEHDPTAAAAGYARKIVDAILPADRRDDIIANLQGSLINQMRGPLLARFNDPGLRQIIDGFMASVPDRLRPITVQQVPLILDAMVKAHVREFSVEELKQISTFSATPAGIHYLSRGAALVADHDVAAANRAYFAEAEIAIRPMQDELAAAMRDYLAKHPEVASKLQQEATQRK